MYEGKLTKWNLTVILLLTCSQYTLTTTVWNREGGVFYILFDLLHSFFLFIPLSILQLCVGRLVKSGPVHAFRKLAGPLFKGVGWALVYEMLLDFITHCAPASVRLFYIIQSIMPNTAEWALKCGHWWNTEDCWDTSTSVGTKNDSSFSWQYSAPQFYSIYALGRTHKTAVISQMRMILPEGFYWSLPPFHLIVCAVCLFGLIYFFCSLRERINKMSLQVFAILPIILFAISAIGIFAAHFLISQSVNLQNIALGKGTERKRSGFFNAVYKELESTKNEILSSTLLSGVVLMAGASDLANDVEGDFLYIPLFAMLIRSIAEVPLLIISTVCEDYLVMHHGAGKSFEYYEYDTISLPRCVAVMPLSQLWLITYFVGVLLFVHVGPMVLFLCFMERSLCEQFPNLKEHREKTLRYVCFALLFITCFTLIPGMDTIIEEVRGFATSYFPRVITIGLLLFVYGYENLEKATRIIINLQKCAENIFARLFAVTGFVAKYVIIMVVPANYLFTTIRFLHNWAMTSDQYMSYFKISVLSFDLVESHDARVVILLAFMIIPYFAIAFPMVTEIFKFFKYRTQPEFWSLFTPACGELQIREEELKSYPADEPVLIQWYTRFKFSSLLQLGRLVFVLECCFTATFILLQLQLFYETAKQSQATFIYTDIVLALITDALNGICCLKLWRALSAWSSRKEFVIYFIFTTISSWFAAGYLLTVVFEANLRALSSKMFIAALPYLCDIIKGFGIGFAFAAMRHFSQNPEIGFGPDEHETQANTGAQL